METKKRLRVEKIDDYFPTVKQVLEQTSEEWVSLRKVNHIQELFKAIRSAPGNIHTVELSLKLYNLVQDAYGDDKKGSPTRPNTGTTLYGATLWVHPNLKKLPIPFST